MSTLAILFSGQGAQEKGMGRDAAESSGDAKELWLLAEKASGLPLREIYWDGSAEDMADTRALQPALTAVNLGYWLALKGRAAPACAAGHSLGEFAALAAAGALAGPDAIALVALRGRLMAEAGGAGQGMAAVLKLDQAAVEDIVARAVADSGAELRIANYNTPKQFVVSGEDAALARAAELAKEAKGRAVPLAVSGAFHSPLIKEAADEFAKAVGKVDWRAPGFPVFHNVSAGPEATAEATRARVAEQMTASVRWVQTIAGMHAAGAGDFVEIGPKPVLARMVPAILGDAEHETRGVHDMAAAEAFD